MTQGRLFNWRILIVEDDQLIADSLALFLESLGAIIVGSIGNADTAIQLAASQRIDVAILDIRLTEEKFSFPVADILIKRGTPLVFVTGSDLNTIPKRFDGAPRCAKPVDGELLVCLLEEAVTHTQHKLWARE